MHKIPVGIHENQLKRIAGSSPIEGLKEMVWNSLDADASEVRISFEYNEAGSVEYLTVIDNGHGLSLEKAKSVLGDIGYSEKTQKISSPKGRRFHGKLGAGRYKAFAIGVNVKWVSTYCHDDGRNRKITINFSGQSGKEILISPEEVTNDPCGMKVFVSMIPAKSSNALTKQNEVTESLLFAFAPYIISHKKSISIFVSSALLDVENAIESEANKHVIFNDENTGDRYNATINIIKWKNSNKKGKYYCTTDGAALLELPLIESMPLSVYILSDYYYDMMKDGAIEAASLGTAGAFFDAETNEFLHEYKRNLRKDAAIDEIKYLKDNNIYPFRNNPSTEFEAEQIKLFDIIAVKFNQIIPSLKKSSREEKKLTYNLIAEAVKTNPSSLKRILHEVFNLSIEQQDDFAKLLDQVSLSNVISTAKEITDRLIFLDIVNDLVYTKTGSGVRERSQFHKMIEQNLWIFGDSYKFGTSDRSLKNILLHHIAELDRLELQPTVPDDAIDNMDLIPDLCLWNQQMIGEGLYENLIVELKRPNKILTYKELLQISKYSQTVSENPGFDKNNFKWHFILIGKDFDDSLAHAMRGKGGVFIEDVNIKVSILKWSELLAKNKIRYQFVKDRLDLVPTNEIVSNQIQTVFGHLFNQDNGNNLE